MIKGCGKEKNLPAFTAVTPNNIGTPRKGIEGFQTLSTTKPRTRSTPNIAMDAAQCTAQRQAGKLMTRPLDCLESRSLLYQQGDPRLISA